MNKPNHQLGTSIQDLGPLDGSGSVLDGLAVRCGCCGKRFMVEQRLLKLKMGSSIWDLKPQQGTVIGCPYCAEVREVTPVGSVLRDTRPRSAYD
jgi:hypothetical protein